MRTLILMIAALLAVPALARDTAPYSDESVARGSELYQRHCTECHGRDGRARMDVISDATDLTDPDAYYNGAGAGQMYDSIRKGAGVGMPPWSMQIPDEADTWHLVNFIRSLWTQKQRDSIE